MAKDGKEKAKPAKTSSLKGGAGNPGTKSDLRGGGAGKAAKAGPPEVKAAAAKGGKKKA